jgi:hypothetical protein
LVFTKTAAKEELKKFSRKAGRKTPAEQLMNKKSGRA